MTKREIAAAFLETAGMGDAAGAFERFVAPGFFHHNPHFPSDRASLMSAMTEAHRASPNKAVEVKHAWQDGDTIITHSLVTRTDAAAPAIAVVHIFRFEGDRIAELWDVGAPLPKDSPNARGPF